MDKNKKKGGKFLLSLLLILLCIGTAGTTGYAVVTGHMPPIITSIVNIFTGDDKSENVKQPPEINMKNTSSEISPDVIEDTETITHKEQESSDDEFNFNEDEYENDNSMYLNTSNTESDFESEPVTITTDTSQDTTSQPSISAPTNKPTNNPPIPLPTPEEPTVKPIPNKPLVPPTDNKHTDDDTSSSARHRHKKPSISGITLDKKELTLNKGDISSHLVATITPSNATGNKIIKWSSKDEAIATVDKDGNVSAVGEGTTNIVATTSNGKTAECKVTVLVPPTGIKINSESFSIDKGLSKTLTATVEPADCTDKSVIWATSNNDVLSVDDSGKITAVAPGTATITAATADGKFSSDCEVTVVISISKLELNKTETTLIKGTEETLTATVTPQDTTEEKKVQWISSDENICTVDENGRVTAINGGTATITAQVGSHIAECEVTVIVPVSGVSINKSELRLAKDTEETLTANILPGDATDKVVEWSSSNPEIATVDENGKVTGVEVGTATVTVKTHDGEFTADCTVNVVIPVTGIKLDKTELSIIRKDTAVLIPTITPDNATDKSVIWSSSNENICTVDENGKVTGTGVGTAVITAKSHDGGFTAECKVTVTPDEYTITANAENGKVVGAGTHHVGTDVTLNAVPDEHYHFVNWTYDGKEISTEPTYVIKNLNKDISITANFEIDYHTVTVKASEGGTVSGGGRFAHGTEITLTAMPDEGFKFVKWSDGNVNTVRKYTVLKDQSITAIFKANGTDESLFEIEDNGDGTCSVIGYTGKGIYKIEIPKYIKGKKVISIKNNDIYCAFDDKGLFEDVYEIVIPNSVKTIGNGAFSNNDCLITVSMPNSVTSINDYAFYKCASLKNITIPNSVKKIGEFAFSDCKSLENILLPNTLKSIEGYAFSDCDSISSITIPNTVKAIGDGAFLGCDSLENIVLPNTLKSISADTFNGCNKLTSISIPDTVTSIGDAAFKECESFVSINIPNSVKAIGDLAFSECSSISSITIPSSIEKMGYYVFCCWNSEQTINIYGKSSQKQADKAWGGCNWRYNAGLLDVFEPEAIPAHIVYHG